MRGSGSHKCVKIGLEAPLGQPEAKIKPPAAMAQKRAAEKEALTIERMKPRPCRLPTCQSYFIPKRPQDWKSEFCCKEHQKEFWVMINRRDAEILKSNLPAQPIESEFKAGVSHREQVLAILERNANQWVEHPRRLLPNVVWNSRVADLRREGHKIERRTVGQKPYVLVPGPGGRLNWRKFLPGGKVEYQYMLVRPEVKQ